MSEREAFEAWAFENGLQSHTDQSLDYPLGNVLWKCWQGRAAIEAQRVPDGLKDARDFLTAVVGAFGPDGDGTSFTAETWDKIHESISVLLAAAPPVAQRCPNCDDTGDVHTIDGQWRGTCHCPACQAINARQAQPAERKPLAITPLSQAMAMYAKYPTYRGTHPLSWLEAPQEVRDEWLQKDTNGIGD